MYGNVRLNASCACPSVKSSADTWSHIDLMVVRHAVVLLSSGGTRLPTAGTNRRGSW